MPRPSRKPRAHLDSVDVAALRNNKPLESSLRCSDSWPVNARSCAEKKKARATRETRLNRLLKTMANGEAPAAAVDGWTAPQEQVERMVSIHDEDE